MTFIEKVKEVVGDAWGRVSTVLLALGIAILPVLQTIDPTFLAQNPWLKWTVIVVSLAVATLRIMAPPPPSVAIKTADAVTVDAVAGTVTIAKAAVASIPTDVVSKPAGQTVVEAARYKV